ncbi:solute carrier family 66 member 2 isoform X1 [Neodiprion virginianus]|uniref:solute carrier family 66 member 2 isoform X1 n=1 Tax=Neodiprion virginianus TaxID=2961670 RepID=UPI001EE6FCE8|nr:solute carrier family 66 member 2 isoform X1 [Neodiprion virginianus]
MGDIFEGYEELSITKLASYVASGAMIFGGVVPYIPQYREIKRKEDSEGFSLYVCLALLIANTLRILFWFGKHFETPLLLQSILMNITMLVMIKLCISVKNKNQIIKAKERVFTDLDIKFFWQWTDFQSYLDFILLFGAVGAVITYLFVDVLIFVEMVGLLAVLTEAMLGVPQLLHNFRNQSTDGMSITMVAMWTMGDTFKTCYFIAREAPMQFGICGALQVMVKEFDYNNDGLNDALKFELCFFAKIPINSVRLLLFFNYELRERNKLAMETMAALQYTIPTNVQRISIVGDLRLDQKILLHNQGIHDIYNYSTDINDFTLFELLTENARRKFAIQIANDKLTWERGFSVEKETVVQTEIFYSEEMIHYRPGLWEELKWAWIQYFAIFFLFASVGKYIIKIIFVKGYVRSYVIPPWKEK